MQMIRACDPCLVQAPGSLASISELALPTVVVPVGTTSANSYQVKAGEIITDFHHNKKKEEHQSTYQKMKTVYISSMTNIE